MFLKNFTQYRALPRPVRSLIFLHWLYTLETALIGAFIQVFLYVRFDDVAFNIIAAMGTYTGGAIGFCLFGFLIARFRVNSKYGFALSFVVMGASIALLLTSEIPFLNLLFVCVYGIGHGLYWLTINTFELTETKDTERDYYASLLSAGGKILSLIGPAFATILIWLSGTVFGIGEFTLLFLTTPLVYLMGWKLFGAVRDYHPSPLEWSDVAYYFKNPYNRKAQWYFFWYAFEQTLAIIVIPLAIFFIVGSALNVGLFNIALSIFSAVCLMFVAQVRTPHNRLLIVGIVTAIMVPTILFFGLTFTFTTLVMVSVVMAILSPLRDVTLHVINLQTMGTAGRLGRDFYATMILRDATLWIGRLIAGVIFLTIALYMPNEQQTISWGIYLFGGAYFLTYLGAAQLLKNP